MVRSPTVTFSGQPLMGLAHENRRETPLAVELVLEDPDVPAYELQLSFAPSVASGPILTLEGAVEVTVAGDEVSLRSGSIELYGVDGRALNRLPGEVIRPWTVARTTYLGRVVLGDDEGPVPIVSGGVIKYVQTEKAGIRGDLITGGVSHFAKARLSLTEGSHRIDWRVSFSSPDTYASYEMRPSFTFVGAIPGPKGPYGSVVGKIVGGVPRVTASTIMKFEAFPLATIGNLVSLRVPVELGYGSSYFGKGGLYEVVDLSAGTGAFRSLKLTGSPGETAGVTVVTEPYPLSPLTTPERCTYQTSSSNPEFGSFTVPREAYYQDSTTITRLELALGMDPLSFGGVDEGWVCTFNNFYRLREFLRRPPGAYVVNEELQMGVVLEDTLTNPTQCKGWVYATELLTLNINLVRQNRLLVITPNSLGAFTYEGGYVYDIVNAANRWIGGGGGDYVPYALLKNLNESFVGGRASRWALENLSLAPS